MPDTDKGLRVAAGDRVTAERRPTRWPGWLWCTTSDGRSGWAPEPWLRFRRSTCTVLYNYDGTELAVTPGDRLTVTLSLCAWALADAADGRRGWVPLECLEFVAP